MNIQKALFNIQRIQILQSKLNPSTADLIPDDYAYAWNVELFPLLANTGIHTQYELEFRITSIEVDKVTEFADTEWSEERYYSFYDYENRFLKNKEFKITTQRWHLIAIFRYMYLRDSFDDTFWKKLIENGKCPVEAFGIIRDFDIKELNLI